MSRGRLSKNIKEESTHLNYGKLTGNKKNSVTGRMGGVRQECEVSLLPQMTERISLIMGKYER